MAPRSVGQVESGRQVSLGVNEIAERGLNLAKETMGSKTDQRLIRCAGECQRFRCDRTRASHSAAARWYRAHVRAPLACPSTLSLQASQSSWAVSQA